MMTRKRWALALLVAGIGCLIGYICLLLYSTASFLTVAMLVISIACNTAALEIYLAARSAKSPRKDEDDA